ncbi:hypothetical protein DYB32_000203 [Aphanomyces invadans]|uniref:Uncharacterized protein n=1 Tax=Aphanomyces invadans TaxID=157072 RepID=A0A418BAN7_9STRA|nr:hypothetical protein DYB32_000203 [Aphanomyces invadans]
MHNIFQRVRKQKQQQKRYEKGLPAMKKDDFAKRLQELSARQPSSGYQPNRLVMLEHLEQAQSVLEPLKPLKTSRTTKELVPRSNHAASKLKPAHSTTDLIDVDTHVAAPVERKLPPLYYRMQQVWGTSLTSSVSEEERLGLPTTENARMLFGIDIYEAKVSRPRSTLIEQRGDK